ncbi:hypothetical protein MKZ21_30745 [Paenibacillus sp. FSL P2-0536]|uniref:hypothetical protein n=1 Tax=Paenibacillus sp. FSL P2-0536 TaxID=2921629 RepID=UPI0030FD154E
MKPNPSQKRKAVRDLKLPRLTLCINPDVKEEQHHGCAIMPKQRAAGGHRREDAARVLRF